MITNFVVGYTISTMGFEIFVVIALLVFSALFSGLNLGLLSLSAHELKRKIELGNTDAAKVYPLRRKGNQLLVTLLVGNVLVNSMLAVFLGDLTSGIMAVVFSTVLITLLGEIIPQAVFSRYALTLGAKLALVVEKIMWLLSPIAYPLSLLLDKALGAELPPIFTKDELVKIMEEHSQSDDSDVRKDELRIVEHALAFGDKQIKEVMTPRKVVRFVKSKDSLSPALLDELHKTGFSRFPVRGDSDDEIVGTLYLHDLVEIKDKSKVGDAMDKKIYFVNESEKLAHALNAFFKTKHHMYMVVNEFSEVVGIITIEDIIEEILGKQIVDEFDQYEDMRAVALRKSSR